MPSSTAAQEIARLEGELDAVRASILRTLQNRSYSSGEVGVAAQRESLKDLRADEATLEEKLGKARRRAAGARGFGVIRILRGVPLR